MFAAYCGEFIVLSVRTKRMPESRYNLFMHLSVFAQMAIVAMRILEIMFFVGLAGSTVVVLISFAEDGKELFGKDEPPESRADRPASVPSGTPH